MTMDWQVLSINDKEAIDKFLQRYPINLSDYNFTNLWMWHAFRNYQIAWTDNLLCIKYRTQHCPLCDPHLQDIQDSTDDKHCVDDTSVDPSVVTESCLTDHHNITEKSGQADQKRPHKKLHSIPHDVLLYPIGVGDRKAIITELANQNLPFFMRAIPETAVGELADPRWKITPEVGHHDYIYAFEDLLLLPGNQHQAKRNLINQFIRNYTFEFQAIASDLIPQLVEMEHKWYTEHANKSRQMLEEHHASLRALESFGALKVIGGLLMVNKEIAAYSIAEQINSQMLVIHVEKALHDYKGAYAMMNQQLLQHVTPTQYVNREEDLGVSNLAKGKRSYHPLRLEMKYQLCT